MYFLAELCFLLFFALEIDSLFLSHPFILSDFPESVLIISWLYYEVMVSRVGLVFVSSLSQILR